MNKLHLAIATDKIEATIEDYSKRLAMRPCTIVPGEYALWRTEFLNLSIRHDRAIAAGTVRHLGWEDTSALEFSQETDVNGMIWERFSAQQQADEINALWPEANYQPT